MDHYVTVCVTLANIRRQPVDMKLEYLHDELQETQVLYNERLLVKNIEKDWIFVEAEEQKTFKKENRWQGYPGWIKKENVVTPVKRFKGSRLTIKKKVSAVYKEPCEESSILLRPIFGTRFFVMGQDEINNFYNVELADGRDGWVKKTDVSLEKKNNNIMNLKQQLVDYGRLFLDTPYLWGGRSIFVPGLDTITGVDCSGLVNLVYRTVNIDIPRDAHDQWLATERIPSKDLDAGDLIFVSEPNNPEKIVHVILYAGDEKLIEANETGKSVREIDFFKRFSTKLSKTKDVFIEIENRYLYFGRVRA